MTKSQFVEQYFDILNTFSDLITSGQKSQWTMPDFSHFDKQPQISQKAHSPTNESNPNLNATTQKEIKQASQETRQMVELASQISTCKKCEISNYCKNKCVGQGNPQSDILIVSYINEEQSNNLLPLPVASYNLLKKMFTAINFNIDQLFVTNIIKCTPKNPKITVNNIENCLFHLDQEIKIVNPKVIFALGSEATSSLCHKLVKMDQYHGQPLNYRGFPVFPTFHPEEMIRNPYLRKPVWDDLQKFANLYDRLLNERGFRFE